MKHTLSAEKKDYSSHVFLSTDTPHNKQQSNNEAKNDSPFSNSTSFYLFIQKVVSSTDFLTQWQCLQTYATNNITTRNLPIDSPVFRSPSYIASASTTSRIP